MPTIVYANSYRTIYINKKTLGSQILFPEFAANSRGTKQVYVEIFCFFKASSTKSCF